MDGHGHMLNKGFFKRGREILDEVVIYPYCSVQLANDEKSLLQLADVFCVYLPR